MVLLRSWYVNECPQLSHLLTDGAWRLLLLLSVLRLSLHGLVLLEARLRAKVLELPLLPDRRQEATVALRGDVPLAVCAHLEGSGNQALNQNCEPW